MKAALDKTTATIPPNNFGNLTQEPTTEQAFSVLEAGKPANCHLQNIQMWHCLGAKASDQMISQASPCSFRVMSFTEGAYLPVFLRLPRVMC